jgi:hypothetical protein
MVQTSQGITYYPINRTFIIQGKNKDIKVRTPFPMYVLRINKIVTTLQ